MTSTTPALPFSDRRSVPERRRVVSARVQPVAPRWAALAADAAALAVAALGLLVLAGWAFDIDALKRVLPGLPTMKVNTAICFALAGTAQWLLHPARPESFLRAGHATAVAPLVIGVVTLGEYATGADVAIDQLLFADPTSLAHPGRPSPITALAFALAGASMLAVRPHSAAALRWSQYLAAALAAFVFVGLLGYLYDAALIRSIAFYTSMALHTVLGLLVLLVGMLLARAETGFMRLLVGDDAGAVIARRLAPAVLVFGVGLGWVTLALQDAGLLDTRAGVAVMVAGLCGFVVVLTLVTAAIISRKDQQLRANLEAVRLAEQRTADLAASLAQARNRLSLALRSSQTGVWDWDVGSGGITWDRQMYDLYGVPPGSDVRYETWANAVVPEDLPQAEANLQRAIQHKAATDNLFRIRLAGGAVRHIAASQDVLLDDAGQVVRVIGMNRDVTALREMEARLRASEEKLRLSFRYSAVGAAIVSLQGRFDEANEALCGMVGYSAAQLTALTHQAITHPDDVEKDLEFTRDLLAGTIASYHLEKRYLHREGHVVWVRISVALVRDDEGAPQHFVVQVEDVTQRREAQDNAARALRELESFSYSVAHDLRAPLRAIGGFSKLLARKPSVADDAHARELLEEINQGAVRMGQLIDDLLTLSKVERGAFRRERIDVSAMAREILGRLARESPDRRVDWVVQEGLVADADARLLRIALENLLGNAWKYTRQRTPARIEVGAQGSGVLPVFFVRDNGAGFDMAHAPKLFQPFQRLHASTEFEGTGIGLATVRRIVDRHGGRLSGEGRVGEGATFTFTLE